MWVCSLTGTNAIPPFVFVMVQLQIENLNRPTSEDGSSHASTEVIK